jgi:hypothetical protein
MKCETRVYEHFLQVRGRGLAMLLILLLPGCGVMTELSNTGRAPPLTPITNPTDAKNYQPVSMPTASGRVMRGRSSRISVPRASAIFSQFLSPSTMMPT